MNYKGFKYTREEHCYDGEIEEVYHTVTTPDNKTVYMDFSSWDFVTEADFQLWVDLGMPDRHSPELGKKLIPINGNDLITIKNWRTV